MYTAMAVVALTMGLTSGTLSPTPTWTNDYQLALAKVSQAGKPMVVFVGSGKSGYTSAVREGFNPAIAKLLSSKFVCMYVDTTTTSGRKLANALEIKDVGVVISNRTGSSQAYSAAAAVSRAELERALVKYSDEPDVKQTEVVPAGGPVPMGGGVMQAGYVTGGGYGYGGGCCGSSCGGGGCGYGYGGGCCGSSCCGKGYYGAPMMVAAPAPAGKAPAPQMKGKAPAPAPVMMAAPMGYGYRGGCCGGCCGWGGGCCGSSCGYGGCCGSSYGYGGCGGGGCCGSCCGW